MTWACKCTLVCYLRQAGRVVTVMQLGPPARLLLAAWPVLTAGYDFFGTKATVVNIAIRTT